MVSKKNKYKIMFLLPSLSGGGAEKVTLNLIRRLSRDRFQPILVTTGNEVEYPDLIPDDVKFHKIGSFSPRYSFLSFGRLSNLVRKEKPDAIIAALFPSSILAYWLRLTSIYKGVIIQVVRNDISSIQRRHSFLWWVFVCALRNANCVLCIARGMVPSVTGKLKINREKVVNIPNPHDINRIRELAYPAKQLQGDPVIISVGSLTEQKGYEYLIRAMKIVVQQHSKAQLYILGKGELEKNLIALTESLCLKDSVNFLGFQENPYTYLARADLYVMPSLWEGLPGVLIEALAIGLPIVATEDSDGVREILQDGRYGTLVPSGDTRKLANGIIDYLNFKADCITAESLRKRADEFSNEQIIPKYENLITGLIQTANHE